MSVYSTYADKIQDETASVRRHLKQLALAFVASTRVSIIADRPAQSVMSTSIALPLA